MSEYVIMQRYLTFVNTDLPQRRCYAGAHPSGEWRWAEWEVLEQFKYMRPGAEDRRYERLQFWRDLNAYSVRECGGVISEYKLDRESLRFVVTAQHRPGFRASFNTEKEASQWIGDQKWDAMNRDFYSIDDTQDPDSTD